MSENSSDASVRFLLTERLAEISFNPALPDGLTFADASSGVEITIKPERPDGFRPLVCKARVSLAAPAAAHKFITSLLARKFEAHDKMPVELPYKDRDRTLIAADGSISEGFGVPFELYPLDVQALCDTAREMLLQRAYRLVRLLRWQQNLDGPHWVFDGDPALYWNVGGSSYQIVGRRGQERVGASPAGIEWNELDRADLDSVWNEASSEESVAHELLREAKVLREHSPRSAFLIATSALEVGVKAYVAHLSPDTSWLLSELPSPPIHKILRAYIPELHQHRGTPIDYWGKLKPWFKRVESGAITRNKLVHTGAIQIEPKDLTAYLQDVSDLLYLFDILRGHEWAKHNVSSAMRAALGWPSSRRKRYIVLMRSGGL
ncbi:hypothetical protein [Bradyrhizobium sp.]|uniref:hypothetical protein n=1 Tax=Bradyrhizobium sp. TaxID=376 RepID=UPI002636B471|nr:hypothetical protein [Bradyrhizobium sp.]